MIYPLFEPEITLVSIYFSILICGLVTYFIGRKLENDAEQIGAAITVITLALGVVVFLTLTMCVLLTNIIGG